MKKHSCNSGLFAVGGPIRTGWLIWGAWIVLCLVIGNAWGQEKELLMLLPEDPLAGGKLFVEKGCVHCHAIYGEGGKRGPDLGKTKLNHGFLELAGVMWNHSPRMEGEFSKLKLVRPTFSAEEMAKIIAFVYFLNYFDSPGDAERGKRLFEEKACSRCHSVGGVGGKSAKSLDRFRRYASSVFMSTAMWNSGDKMADAMHRLGIQRPTFEPGDVRDILTYVRKGAEYDPDEDQVFLPPGNPRNGSRLFRTKHCTDCHAIQGSAWSAGPDLAQAELRGSLSTIAGFQWNHGPAMWEMMRNRGLRIPRFTEQEMSDIVAYLFFLQYEEAPGDEAAGRRLFGEKGCENCHGGGSDSTAIGPGVKEMEPFRNPAEVIAAMWNHASEMEQMTWEMNIVWPILKDTEMADLIAFLLSESSVSDTESP